MGMTICSWDSMKEVNIWEKIIRKIEISEEAAEAIKQDNVPFNRLGRLFDARRKEKDIWRPLDETDSL